MGTWAIPVISAAIGAAAAVIGILTSKPEKRVWAYVSILGIVLTLVVGIWQSASLQAQEETTKVLRQRAVRQLTVATGEFLIMLAQITNAASDGWIPVSEDTFFSRHTAELFCGHLDLQKESMTFPSEPWWRFVGDSTTKFRSTLKEVLEVSGPYLDAGLAKSVTSVESSIMMAYLDRTRYVQAYLPSTFCGGVEREVVESLNQLRELARILRAKNAGDTEQVVTEPWKLFGRPDLLGKRGRARM